MDPKNAADIAIQLIAGSAVKCDPSNLDAAQGVLNMLHGIKTGKYLVVNAPATPAPTNGPTPKVRRK